MITKDAVAALNILNKSNQPNGASFSGQRDACLVLLEEKKKLLR